MISLWDLRLSFLYSISVYNFIMGSPLIISLRDLRLSFRYGISAYNFLKGFPLIISLWNLRLWFRYGISAYHFVMESPLIISLNKRQLNTQSNVSFMPALQLWLLDVSIRIPGVATSLIYTGPKTVRFYWWNPQRQNKTVLAGLRPL
jgi:hypothetical protein